MKDCCCHRKESTSEHELQQVAHNLAERIASNGEACTLLVEHLDDSSRQHLIVALAATHTHLSRADKENLDQLLAKHDVAAAFKQLNRSGCQDVMRACSC